MTASRRGLTDPRGPRRARRDPRASAVGDDAGAIAKADSYGLDLLDWRSLGGTVAAIGDGGDGVEASVEKAAGAAAPRSRQIKDPFENLYTYGNAVIPPLDPYRMLQLSENNAIHSACVLAKAADAVGRGWTWEPTAKDVDPSKVKGLDQTLEDITPGLSFSEMLRQAVWEKEMVGWSGWEVAREAHRDGLADVFTGDEKLAGLFPIPSHTIRATKDENVWVQIKNVEVRYFKVFGCEEPYDAFTGQAVSPEVLRDYLAGKKVRFEPAREIIVFRTYTPRSPYYGVPTWIGAMPAIAELQAIREFNISFFQSGGTVDRIIHVKSDSDDTAKAIAEKVVETIRDAAGRGHVTVVTFGNPQTGIEVLPMNGPQGPVGGRDAQFVKRRDDLIKEVLMAHNVPPYRIGLAELGSLGGSAAKEMLRSYKVGTIEADQSVLEDRLNHTLFGPKGLNVDGFRWKLESLDWDETELNLSIATQGVTAGVLTRNEARDLIGQERYEDPAMDKITVTAPALLPVTTTEEASAFKSLIGEWKTALEAVIRGEEAVEPTGPEGPGTVGAESAPTRSGHAIPQKPLAQGGSGNAADAGQQPPAKGQPPQLRAPRGGPPPDGGAAAVKAAAREAADLVGERIELVERRLIEKVERIVAERAGSAAEVREAAASVERALDGRREAIAGDERVAKAAGAADDAARNALLVRAERLMLFDEGEEAAK